MILSLLRVKDFAVEDMMRSSFAEFRAQREQPEVVAARTRYARALSDLQAKPWPSGPGRCVPPPLCITLCGMKICGHIGWYMKPRGAQLLWTDCESRHTAKTRFMIRNRIGAGTCMRSWHHSMWCRGWPLVGLVQSLPRPFHHKDMRSKVK